MQVHTKIDEGPLDTFTFVLFLLKNEHVVVEELLQFLVGEIDAKLLETVVLRVFFFLCVRAIRSHKGKGLKKNSKKIPRQRKEQNKIFNLIRADVM